MLSLKHRVLSLSAKSSDFNDDFRRIGEQAFYAARFRMSLRWLAENPRSGVLSGRDVLGANSQG
jgi:hypothetical protein